MSRPVLLLIAYHFPPDNAIGGERPFRFYKYLKRLGYECHVLTAACQERAGVGPDVEYVPDPLRTRPRQGLAWQAERIGWKFFSRSGLVLGWSVAAWRAGRSFLDARKAAERVTILSSSPPVGTHLAAWRLAQYSGRPWIADFRDPIERLPGYQAVLGGVVAPRLERMILKRAALVLANTDSMRDTFISRCADVRPNVQLLWNGFDPEDVIRPYPLSARECKVLSHVGALYGGRNIRPLLYAVARLIETGGLSGSRIKVRQVGEVERSELPEETFLCKAKANGWLELRDSVPAAEARSIALDSDGLLLIQPHTAVQVPGKLFEYLRMGRPILAFVVRGSPVERILERAGVPYECIYPENTPEEIERHLLSFLGELNGQPVAPSAWFRQSFEASRQTEVLDGLIRSLEAAG